MSAPESHFPLPTVSRLEDILVRMSKMRSLVVGDVLLDEYRVGDVDRVSPEAPVPIVRVSDTAYALGGAGNVARNADLLGASTRLVGIVGDDAEGIRLHELLEHAEIESADLVAAAGRPTTHKLRVVARGQQMLRLDREEVGPLPEGVSRALMARVAERLSEVDLVLLVDYDKGVFSEANARAMIERARSIGETGLPVVVDPKKSVSRFRGASLVKPNWTEALRLAGGGGGDAVDTRAVCEKIRDESGGSEVVVTRGRGGMSALDRAGVFSDVPTRSLEVYDVQGAGDTAVAALGLARAAGASLLEACIVANAAASVVVEKLGTAAVGRAELRARLPEVLQEFTRIACDNGHARMGEERS